MVIAATLDNAPMATAIGAR